MATKTTPNCYDCVYKRGIAGDAHSRCTHHGKIIVKGNPIGIRRGWFHHPYNFDPTWLLECNGFTKKEEA